MVAFSSILAVGTLIASTLAAPLHFSELDRRALQIGISAATARTYLSQRERIRPQFFSTVFQRYFLPSDGCNAIQLPRI